MYIQTKKRENHYLIRFLTKDSVVKYQSSVLLSTCAQKAHPRQVNVFLSIYRPRPSAILDRY
jgi:hypothetical protein